MGQELDASIRPLEHVDEVLEGGGIGAEETAFGAEEGDADGRGLDGNPFGGEGAGIPGPDETMAARRQQAVAVGSPGHVDAGLAPVAGGEMSGEGWSLEAVDVPQADDREGTRRGQPGAVGVPGDRLGVTRLDGQGWTGGLVAAPQLQYAAEIARRPAASRRDSRPAK